MRRLAKHSRSVASAGCILLGAGVFTLLLPMGAGSGPSNLTRDELASAGFHGLVFGSQRSEGIQTYDLATGKFVEIISSRGEGRYILPRIARTGRGVCLKDSRYGEVINFDLNAGSYAPLKNLPRTQYHQLLALSHDGNSVALLFNRVDGEFTPILGVYDLTSGQLAKTYELGDYLKETPASVLWAPDDKSLMIVWRAYTKIPTVRVEISSGRSVELPYHIEAFKGDGRALIRGEKSQLFMLDQGTGAMEAIDAVSEVNTSHDFSFSQDGKYLSYGWLRGKGFETLCVIELSSGRRFQLNLDDHPGTVLGLALW